MTRDAVTRGAEYVIWPESSTPFMFERGSGGRGRRSARSRARCACRFCSAAIRRIDAARAARSYNAAFLVAPDGETAAVYRKIHLVPFGEFIPFKRVLFFVSPLVERFTDFSPGHVDGDAAGRLASDEHRDLLRGRLSVAHPRRRSQAGSELLTTITNDAWYGHSSAPYQHFALASMRAIEQGRYLARAANTGISGVVDPYGRVVRQSGIFEQAGLVEEVRFLTVARSTRASAT